MPSTPRKRWSIPVTPSPNSMMHAELIIAQAKLKEGKQPKTLKSKGEKKKPTCKPMATTNLPPNPKGNQVIQTVDESSGNEDENGGAQGGEVPAAKAGKFLVNWASEDLHYLTHKLLGFIEENLTWKVALGFEKGTTEQVNSSGKKLIEHYHTLAQRLLIEDDSGRWADMDLVKLGDVVKNRVNALKKKYSKLRTEIGETGQGLLDEDCELEIWQGTRLSNVWEKVQKSFPWYKRLHTLMGMSPVVDRSAVGHSMSELDLSVLGTASNSMAPNSPEEGRSQSPMWDIEYDNGVVGELGGLPNDITDMQAYLDGHLMDFHAGSPGLDGPESTCADSQPSKTPTCTDSQPSKPVPLVAVVANNPKKRCLQAIDKANDIATAHREAHAELAAKSIKGRIERE
ncbi:hypothetical protein K439DRAFT_1623139 [Ramaria rubella]|nr:hypothetical protein K439DRAFT_1623139 [Ramaria rubella]